MGNRHPGASVLARQPPYVAPESPVTETPLQTDGNDINAPLGPYPPRLQPTLPSWIVLQGDFAALTLVEGSEKNKAIEQMKKAAKSPQPLDQHSYTVLKSTVYDLLFPRFGLDHQQRILTLDLSILDSRAFIIIFTLDLRTIEVWQRI
jgi:hypothetical protein